MPALIAQHKYALEQVTRVVGRLISCQQLAATAAPFLVGYVRDLADGYQLPFLVLAGAQVAAAAAILSGGRRQTLTGQR